MEINLKKLEMKNICKNPPYIPLGGRHLGFRNCAKLETLSLCEIRNNDDVIDDVIGRVPY